MKKESLIKDVVVSLYRIPLENPLVDAMHGTHTHFEVVNCTIVTDDGIMGTGYTYTGGFGGYAIYEMIDKDLKPRLIGKEANAVEQLNEDMQVWIHYVGRGGIASFAISAIDIALWDIRCKKQNMPLWRLLGGRDNKVKTYYGGIDLDFTLDQLVDNIKKQRDNGHRAFKIKLGKPELKEDIYRVKAVRECIGDDAVFMVDANMNWPVEKAIRASRELHKYDIYWLEEPTLPCDLQGYREIANKSPIPIAMGENLHTLFEHRHAITYGKISFPQPDASNICGITGWLQVASLAHAYQLPVSTHGMQELHVSLLAAMGHSGYMEYHSFPIDQYTKRLVNVEEGFATAPDDIGVGVIFDDNKMKPFMVK